jgi:hypothetical protein
MLCSECLQKKEANGNRDNDMLGIIILVTYDTRRAELPVPVTELRLLTFPVLSCLYCNRGTANQRPEMKDEGKNGRWNRKGI